MSLVDDEDPMEEADLDLTTTTNDMEIDTKIKIEEVTINLGCVKRELDDETDYGESSGVNQYRIGENSFKRRDDEDNFMNFSTGDNKIKIENANIKKLYCNNCNGNYVGYCIYCTSLSHIINNVIPNLNSESDFYTIPGDVLGIRDVFERRAVFALKTIPKDVIFGPYHGISAIESTNGCGWKVKNWKFLNDENGNWMRNVCASNQFAKNLDIFQCDKNIYFQTSREIEEGEELLVWYNEEVTQKLENGEECYYVPVEKDESSKIFACTLCCLGFRLERCLVEHKSKCPHAEYNEECEDLEIVECRSCKVWLERQEHLESHMLYCLENCNSVHYLIQRRRKMVPRYDRCFNPFKIPNHGKKPLKNLRRVTSDLQRKLKIMLPPLEILKICDTCRMKTGKIASSDTKSTVSAKPVKDSNSSNKSVEVGKLNETLTLVNNSPTKETKLLQKKNLTSKETRIIDIIDKNEDREENTEEDVRVVSKLEEECIKTEDKQ